MENILNTNTINYYNLKNNDLNRTDLAQKILSELETIGYVVIQNFTDINDIEKAKRIFLEISELVGNPIPHAGEDSIIWDIKQNEKSDSFIKTYSEHSHEAEMHTDSQYSFYPEDYFALLTLKKANCGGGVSTLLSLKAILEALRLHPKAAKIEETLRTTQYPFIVPNVFKKSQDAEHEFNYGPILRDNEIRFRVDTFEKALNFKANLFTEEQLEAYYVLKNIVLNSPEIKSFYLENEDLIFINNKTMLHGRSAFTDYDRHLLRIRMNKKSYSKE